MIDLGSNSLIEGGIGSSSSSGPTWEPNASQIKLKVMNALLAFIVAMAPMQSFAETEPMVPSAHMASQPSTSSQQEIVSAESLESDDGLLRAVLQSLREDLIEDGYDHSAERLLEGRELEDFTGIALYLTNMVEDSDSVNPDLLRLLGRVDVPPALRTLAFEVGICSESVEMRDAAIQAVENWESSELASRLRTHEDEVPWLEEYAHEVVRYLVG